MAPVTSSSGIPFYGLPVPDIDRRSLMLMAGFGAFAAPLPMPVAGATPPRPQAPPQNTATPAYLFHDEFDGPAGSAPDPAKWRIAQARETIKNPVFWDRPENMGQY